MLRAQEGADGGEEEGYGGEPSLCGGEVGCGGADGGEFASELVGVLQLGQQGVGLGAEGVGLRRGASLRRALLRLASLCRMAAAFGTPTASPGALPAATQMGREMRLFTHFFFGICPNFCLCVDSLLVRVCHSDAKYCKSI